MLEARNRITELTVALVNATLPAECNPLDEEKRERISDHLFSKKSASAMQTCQNFKLGRRGYIDMVDTLSECVEVAQVAVEEAIVEQLTNFVRLEFM